MKFKLALFPLMIAGAFARAEQPYEPVQNHSAATEVEKVEVNADQRRLRSAKSYSIASDGDLRDRVNLGLLGKANAFTAPITVVNYDEKIISQNEPRTLVDLAAKTDSSVMAFGGETNTLQGLYVRGLQLDARQFSVNGLAGLYSAYNSPTSNVGSAQLIKGASSATVGMDPEGAVGSAVNIETKKTSDEGNRQIGFGWFSDSRAQTSFDLGQRLGENKQWGIRANGKYRKGDTPRKGYEEDTREFALNSDYRGEKLRASLDASYAKRDTAGGRARVQDIQLYGFRLPDAPSGKTNLVPGWQRQKTKDKSILATFEYSTDWNMQISGGIGHMESRYDGNFSQIQILDTEGNYRNGAYNVNQNRFTNQGAQPVEFISRTTSANLSARGEFATGPVSHNWSAAFDWVQRSRDHDNGTRVGSALMGTNAGLNIYNPVFPAEPALNPVGNQGQDTTYSAPSLAVSDTLGFSDNRLRFTLGGRFQWIKQENHAAGNQDQTSRFSPMLAAAWVPGTDFVVYGNYMEDLEPGEYDDDSGSLGPTRVSRQVELGVRKNWGNIVTSANVYQISRPGYWNAADNDLPASLRGTIQGKERYRGIEFNTYANLLNNTLRPSIGLSYIKADLINTPDYEGNITSGTQVASPRIIAKAGIEYDTPFAKGLTLSGHIQHYGKSYQDTAKQYSFPSYTLVDVGARYSTKLGAGNRLTLSGAIENLFDKNYWQVQRGRWDRSFAVVGMPRTYWLKAELAF